MVVFCTTSGENQVGLLITQLSNRIMNFGTVYTGSRFRLQITMKLIEVNSDNVQKKLLVNTSHQKSHN